MPFQCFMGSRKFGTVPAFNSTPKLWRHFSPFHGATGSNCVKPSAHPFASLMLGIWGRRLVLAHHLVDKRPPPLWSFNMTSASWSCAATSDHSSHFWTYNPFAQ